MEDGKHTLIELIIGIGFCAFLFAIPGFFFQGNKAAYLFGIVMGGVIGCFMAISMFRSLNRSLDLPEEKASGYARKTAFIRLFLLAAVLGVIAAFCPKLQVFGAILGALCLKFSAYLQPLTHKFISKKFLNKGR